jgi:hypothetical protein
VVLNYRVVVVPFLETIELRHVVIGGTQKPKKGVGDYLLDVVFGFLHMHFLFKVSLNRITIKR